jgi:hypothetical protein
MWRSALAKCARLMFIAFQTKALRDLCEDNQIACKSLGPEVAKHLRERLADLRAATTITDLLVGSPRTSGEKGDVLIIGLGTVSHMTWVVNHANPPTGEDGMIDWHRVSRVRLIRLGVC